MFIRIEVYKMTNLEIMDRGVFYTWNAYMNAKQGTMSNEAIDVRAVDYSAQCLYNVINKPDSYAMYTRTDNLRKDMASLTPDAIKNELLKNVVNVATYHRAKNDYSIAGREMGVEFRFGLPSDHNAVILLNIMEQEGIEAAYEKLNDPTILLSACDTFAKYRGEMTRKKDIIAVAENNPGVQYLHNELDAYYTKWGDRPKGVDVTALDSYGYDANGGFSGFGRK